MIDQGIPYRIVVRLSLRDESDVAAARRDARRIASEQRLPAPAAEALTTAVSEVARNVIVHAGGGEILLGIAEEPARIGIVVIVRDEGSGIADLERAMQDGHSTGNGLGLGLPSARRLVDHFEICSNPGQGTTVTMWKWREPAV